MVMRATGGGNKNIGSICNISTTCQSYIDTDGVAHIPTFIGWFCNGYMVSSSEYYTFTVAENASYIAKWSW